MIYSTKSSAWVDRVFAALAGGNAERWTKCPLKNHDKCALPQNPRLISPWVPNLFRVCFFRCWGGCWGGCRGRCPAAVPTKYGTQGLAVGRQASDYRLCASPRRRTKLSDAKSIVKSSAQRGSNCSVGGIAWTLRGVLKNGIGFLSITRLFLFDTYPAVKLGYISFPLLLLGLADPSFVDVFIILENPVFGEHIEYSSCWCWPFFTWSCFLLNDCLAHLRAHNLKHLYTFFWRIS